MGFWKSLGNFAIAVGVTVYREAKSAAKEALIWMADKGHKFIDDVKSTWAAVRPHIEAVIRPIMRGLEAVTATIDWLHGSIKAVNRMLELLVNFVEGPLAYAIEKALRWTFDLAAYIVDNYIRHEDLEVAEQHRTTLANIDTKGMDPKDAHVIDAAAMLLDFHIIRTKLDAMLASNSVSDFEQYLRLRAASKLLEIAERELRKAKTVTDITQDGIFLVKQAGELAKDMKTDKPEISPQDIDRLDRIVKGELGKKLLPLVFQEFLVAWYLRIKALGQDYILAGGKLGKARNALSTLKIKRGPLTERELAELASLETQAQVFEAERSIALHRKIDMEQYVYAAEGFLGFLEKSEAQLQEEGEIDLAEEAIAVAPLILKCAQEELSSDKLGADDRYAIEKFAMIHAEKLRQRMIDLDV